MSYLFTSESVSEGHPDKVADQISDALIDNFLAFDPQSKVACETLVTTGQVRVYTFDRLVTAIYRGLWSISLRSRLRFLAMWSGTYIPLTTLLSSCQGSYPISG